MLAGIALLAIASAAVGAGSGPVSIADPLSTALIEGVRHGGDFYDVARDTLHASAEPNSALPPPALALITGPMPIWAAIVTLGLLCMAVLVAWHARLASSAFAGAGPFTIALVLITAGLPILLGPGAVGVPESWAGLLVALALARWNPARPLEACCWGLAAASFSPFALALSAIMAGAAALQHRQADIIGWMAALAIGAVIWLLHLHALEMLELTGAAPAEDGVALGGALGAFAAATAGGLIPIVFIGALLVLAAFGWTIWRDPIGSRIAALIAIALSLTILSGRVQIALLVAPVWLAGLAFAPDALRDLIARALDRRRMTVTEMAT